MDGWLLELIGYAASILVAVSLMMSSVLRLRVINLMGAVTFAVYGLLIEAYPVAVVNVFIVFINVYHLRRMLRRSEYFRTLEVAPDSEYLHYFLRFYRDQIARFLPEFSYAAADSQLRIFVLRDLVPAGLLIGEVRGERLRVQLDFVIPQYRDFKIARYLFHDRPEALRSRGITEVVTAPGTREHAAYLREIGFAPAERETGGPDLYRFRLPPA